MDNQINRYTLFLKVAELGNITAAAADMNYTQSGVSHAIAALEREAGCTLFYRSKSGVKLTENGKALAPHIRELVEKERALARAMDELSNRVSGTLRVGSFTSFTAVWMARMIRDFTSKYPEVIIELTNGTYSAIEDGLSSGRLDCGFLTANDNDRLDFIPLFDDRMLACCSPEHPIAKKAALPLSELRRYTVIAQFKTSDHDLRQIIRRSGLRPGTRYILDDDISVMGMVAQNEGIAIMPELMLSTAGFDLAVVPLDPPQFRTIGLAALPIKEPTLLMRTFRDFCRNYDFSAANA